VIENAQDLLVTIVGDQGSLRLFDEPVDANIARMPKTSGPRSPQKIARMIFTPATSSQSKTAWLSPAFTKTFSKCAAAYSTSRPAWRRCNGLLNRAHDLPPVPYSEECGCHDQTVLQHSIAARPGASRTERGDRKQSGGVAVSLARCPLPDYGARERNCLT
jgi:hypothetical protein